MNQNVLPAHGGELVTQSDFLVVGSGMAGLYAAIRLSRLGSVSLITKGDLQESNTVHAQGGIAAAVDQVSDSPRLHFEDTMQAGAGFNDPDAVRVLVDDGPARVQDLAALGVQFDRTVGGFSLTREGAHRIRRILHARDATGRAISEGLSERVQELPVQVHEQCMAVELIMSGGVCRGVRAIAGNGRWVRFEARLTVLASGAAGQLYSVTTNPEVATGDGMAMAFRAGASIIDAEFVQFHPTALHLEGAPAFLISESMRGEGAQLLDQNRKPFMERYHPMGSLAPRDVVARAIFDEIGKSGKPFVYLQPGERDPVRLRERFPTIYDTCLRYGLDIAKGLIPVAPAAHYMMGGVRTDMSGRSTIPGLFACGEVACTGVHGANRLASNSLLEAVVFAGRIAAHIEQASDPLRDWPGAPSPNFTVPLVPELRDPAPGDDDSLDPAIMRGRLQETMTENVAIVRNATGMNTALRCLDLLRQEVPSAIGPRRRRYELRNMIQVGYLITRSALYREESRGSHFRSDFPETRPEWRRRIVVAPEK